jgi:hypothetical protein
MNIGNWSLFGSSGNDHVEIVSHDIRIPNGFLVQTTVTRRNAGVAIAQTLVPLKDGAKTMMGTKWEPMLECDQGHTKIINDRLLVNGGWIARTVAHRHESGVSVVQRFVEDPEHAWKVLPPPPGPNPGLGLSPGPNWPNPKCLPGDNASKTSYGLRGKSVM